VFSWRDLSAQGVSRICAHDCIRAVTYLMTEVTLGSKTAIKMAMYYVILQFVFIIVSCISWQYHLMVYHVSFTHVDITKMMPLRKIWEIFTQMSHTSSTQDSIDNKTAGVSLLDSERQLNQLLSSYKSGHTVPIHVYKVLAYRTYLQSVVVLCTHARPGCNTRL